MTKQKSFLDFLVSKNLVDAITLDSLNREAEETNKNIEELILEKSSIKEAEFYNLKSQFLKVPFRDLSDLKIEPEVFRLIPLEAAQHYRFIPLVLDSKKKILEAGMLDPNDIGAREALNFIAHRNNLTPKVFIIGLTDFKNTLKEYSSLKGEVKQALDQLKKEIDEEKEKGPITDKEKIEKIAEEAPISKVVALIIKHAIEQRASDIHVEPAEREVIVRYRIDGILHDAMILPSQVHSGIIARIKVLSNLKLDEHRLPQDGRFKIQTEEQKISFRVSILPTFYGEKIVMRLLLEGGKRFTLESLGFWGESLERIHRAIKKPYGMILATGPTGCGKTTTLYTILEILNQPGVNICTIEDPIEYQIPRINQTQVKPQIGLTFASGLRALVRQDPNVIMVGEIRDTETAGLAINAALTGHLVLSTLHTNSAAGAIPRLVDMGAEQFLIASTINIVMAQRLTRKLCSESKEKYNLTKAQIEEMKKDINLDEMLKMLKREKIVKESATWESIDFYRPKPSKDSVDGYKDRVGIREVLEVSSTIKDLITKNATSDEIEAQARKEGMVTMIEDGFVKAVQGQTTLEEVLRVTRE